MYVELFLLFVLGVPWEFVDRPLLVVPEFPEFPGTCLEEEEEEEEDFELLFVFLLAIGENDCR